MFGFEHVQTVFVFGVRVLFGVGTYGSGFLLELGWLAGMAGWLTGRRVDSGVRYSAEEWIPVFGV